MLNDALIQHIQSQIMGIYLSLLELFLCKLNMLVRVVSGAYKV